MKALSIVIFLSVPLFSNAQSLDVADIDTAQYFDFWVGTWKVNYDEGDGVKELGMNTIDKILDGTVIRETFELTGGKSKGFKGTSISVYQPRFKRWKQAWADNQGGYFDFEGEFAANKRVFKTNVVEQGDQRIQQRMVFYDITPDAFTWDWEMSVDGGESWQLSWRILYERIK